MTRDEYLAEMMPAIDSAIDLLMMMEAKHGKGLHFSDVVSHKAISHMEKVQRGEYNPDGMPHSTASLARAFKVELARLAMEAAA